MHMTRRVIGGCMDFAVTIQPLTAFSAGPVRVGFSGY